MSVGEIEQCVERDLKPFDAEPKVSVVIPVKEWG